MGHYVRGTPNRPQTAAKSAAFVRTIRGLSSEVVGSPSLYG